MPTNVYVTIHVKCTVNCKIVSDLCDHVWFAIKKSLTLLNLKSSFSFFLTIGLGHTSSALSFPAESVRVLCLTFTPLNAQKHLM